MARLRERLLERRQLRLLLGDERLLLQQRAAGEGAQATCASITLSDLLPLSSTSCVTLICARSEASWMAVATTLDVRLSHVASTW